VTRRFRRLLPALLVVVSLFAVGVGCIPANTPKAPFKDAANGTSADHGWFEGGKTWQGDFGDPDILRVGNNYYAYSSSAGGRYLSVLTSTDLKTWTIHPRWSTAQGPYQTGWQTGIPTELLNYPGDSDWGRFDNNDALVKPVSWGTPANVNVWVKRTYWASSVMKIGDTWFAYSAVKVGTVSDDPHHYGRFCLTVASSTKPTGPFRDISGNAPIQCQSYASDPAGSIDPYPYHDPSGKNYLLWKAAGKIGSHESALMSVQLGSDGKPMHGVPWTKLLQTNRAAAWEGSTIENPSMVNYRGTTYLFYSANDSVSNSEGYSNYATGYAICPHGPAAACTRVAGGVKPLMASNGVSQGPGGASPVISPQGKVYLAYASYWLGESRNGYHPRRLHIASVIQNPDRSLRIG
jgi:hypothetical protein